MAVTAGRVRSRPEGWDEGWDDLSPDAQIASPRRARGGVMRRISMMLVAVLVLAGCGSNETAETLDRVWDGMTTEQRLDLCAEVRTAGVDAAADAFVTGVGDSIDRGDVHGWLSERCGD